MAQAALTRTKINTKPTQLARKADPAFQGRSRAGRRAQGHRVSGDARSSARDASRVVVELEYGITVYPPEADGEPWRAVFTENGQRRYRQGATEAKLAARLEKVRERLAACAPNMELPGSGLIAHYLDPDRLPVDDRWSRKHAHTQRRLCERFAAPVIATVTCQDITTAHMQQIVNAAPTPGEGDRVQRMISALVTAGIDGGYVASLCGSVMERTMLVACAAITVACSITNPYEQAGALAVVAAALAQAGHHEQASAMAAEAVTAALSTTDPNWQAGALAAVAEALAQAGQHQQASVVAAQATAAARSIINPDQQADALTAIAGALLTQGDKRHARRLAAAACATGRWTVALRLVLSLEPSATRTLTDLTLGQPQVLLSCAR